MNPLSSWRRLGRRPKQGTGTISLQMYVFASLMSVSLVPESLHRAKTLFCIASCSKAFLATSIGLLIEDYATGKNVTPLPSGLQRFDWDTKLVDIIPKELEWGLQDLGGDDWATRKASIADALGHVGGLPRHDHSYRPGDTSEDVVRRMRLLRTSYELREKWCSFSSWFTPHGLHAQALRAYT